MIQINRITDGVLSLSVAIWRRATVATEGDKTKTKKTIESRKKCNEEKKKGETEANKQTEEEKRDEDV